MYLAVVVEVGVEANRVAARGLQVDVHRVLRVVVREPDVEFEAAASSTSKGTKTRAERKNGAPVLVGRAVRAGDEHLGGVEALLGAAREHRAAVAERQAGRQRGHLLRQAPHAPRTAPAPAPLQRRLVVVGEGDAARLVEEAHARCQRVQRFNPFSGVVNHTPLTILKRPDQHLVDFFVGAQRGTQRKRHGRFHRVVLLTVV